MRRLALAALAATALAVGTASTQAQTPPPFGDPESVDYAQQLWQALQERNLVGADAIRSYAYKGSEPHGVVLEQIETQVQIRDQAGPAIVKSNYMGENLTREQVMNAERQRFLVATTVMFRREAGYNPSAGNWFWAKYLPDGKLDRTPTGTPMAGRVQGCIGCHAAAPGGDHVFLHDRFAN